MKRRQPETVLEYCVAAGGVRKGLRVARFLVLWATAQAQAEHGLSAAEYAEFWLEPEATVYRQQAEFRELFGSDASPALVAEFLLSRRVRRVPDLGHVPLAALASVIGATLPPSATGGPRPAPEALPLAADGAPEGAPAPDGAPAALRPA